MGTAAAAAEKTKELLSSRCHLILLRRWRRATGRTPERETFVAESPHRSLPPLHHLASSSSKIPLNALLETLTDLPREWSEDKKTSGFFRRRKRDGDRSGGGEQRRIEALKAKGGRTATRINHAFISVRKLKSGLEGLDMLLLSLLLYEQFPCCCFFIAPEFFFLVFCNLFPTVISRRTHVAL